MPWNPKIRIQTQILPQSLPLKGRSCPAFSSRNLTFSRPCTLGWCMSRFGHIFHLFSIAFEIQHLRNHQCFAIFLWIRNNHPRKFIFKERKLSIGQRRRLGARFYDFWRIQIHWDAFRGDREWKKLGFEFVGGLSHWVSACVLGSFSWMNKWGYV